MASSCSSLASAPLPCSPMPGQCRACANCQCRQASANAFRPPAALEIASAGKAVQTSRPSGSVAGASFDVREGPEARCIAFVPMVLVACALLMAIEFRQNAEGVNFNAKPTEDCFFRTEVRDLRLCAASLRVNPMFGPRTQVLSDLGGVSGVRISDNGEAWRLATGIFLHSGLIHFAVNMVGLLAVGWPLERIHGAARLATVYMCSGIFGAMASATFAPHLLSVGASGAIFGLIGAAMGDVLLNWDTHLHPCRRLVELVLVTVVNVALGTVPMVDNFAHVFGFVMGLLSSLSLLARLNKRPKCWVTCTRRCFRMIAGCCVVTAFAAMVFMLFGLGQDKANDLCPECAKISCMAFPWGCESRDATSCWWTCETMQAPMPCRGNATWTGSRANATVDLACPIRAGGFRIETVTPVDVTDWSDARLSELCREHCEGMS